MLGYARQGTMGGSEGKTDTAVCVKGIDLRGEKARAGQGKLLAVLCLFLISGLGPFCTQRFLTVSSCSHAQPYLAKT